MDILSLLPFMAVWSFMVGVIFLCWRRVAYRERRRIISDLTDACLDQIDECMDARAKRKGNNFGDQIFRATIKGQEDAFRATVDILKQL